MHNGRRTFNNHNKVTLTLFPLVMHSRKEIAAVATHADSPTNSKDHSDNNNNNRGPLRNPLSERAETFGRQVRVGISTASSSMGALILDKAPAKASKQVYIAPTFFQM
jgi:hypothetical protein